MKYATLLLTSLLFSANLFADTKKIIPTYFNIRSQGANLARHISGMLDHIYACDVEECANYGTLAVTPDYTRSFNGEDITECLFGTQNCPTITISGSRISNRTNQDWLADYFYLPTDFKSTVQFDPVIDNFLVDFNFFIGLDQWFNGFYLNFYAPIVHTRWNLKMCETVSQKGTSSHVAGYFTPNELDRGRLLNSFTKFANGLSINPVIQTLPGLQVNTVFQPLRKAKISSDLLTRTRIADVRMQIGWDFVGDCCYMVGTYLYISGPAGLKPQAEFLFEPMVGNGHHWELGIGFNGFYTFWQNCEETVKFRFYADAYVTYLFDARQHRTFDLINKPFSRYMLAERISPPIVNNLKGNGVTPTAQFRQEFTPVANLTTLAVDVKAGPQTEALFMLDSNWCGWNFDIGYNFWYRGCETILPRLLNPLEQNNMWALKGDAHVFGYLAQADAPLPQNFPIGLSATESAATINSGTNFPVGTTNFAPGVRNSNIDNAKLATGGASDTRLLFEPNAIDNIANQINTSVNPKFPQAIDINICDASHTGLSHKLFAHLSYTWEECDAWIPYFGIGGEAEFSRSNLIVDCSEHCATCGVSQWSIWFKGGFSY